MADIICRIQTKDHRCVIDQFSWVKISRLKTGEIVQKKIHLLRNVLLLEFRISELFNFINFNLDKIKVVGNFILAQSKFLLID